MDLFERLNLDIEFDKFGVAEDIDFEAEKVEEEEEGEEEDQNNGFSTKRQQLDINVNHIINLEDMQIFNFCYFDAISHTFTSILTLHMYKI